MKGHFRGEFSTQRADGGQRPPTEDSTATNQPTPSPCCASGSGLSSRPDPADTKGKPGSERSQDFEIQAALTPATGSQQQAIHDALRLLATWAVRAARAQRKPQNVLDCSPPRSDECTPNQSTGDG